MSKPGSSWLPMPVTETVLPVLSKILTSEPARPPLATIGPPIHKRPIVGGGMFRHVIDVGFIDRVRGGIGIHNVLKGRVIKGEGFTDRIPSTTPGAEPPRDARDSGSARSHSTHLETSSSNRP